MHFDYNSVPVPSVIETIPSKDRYSEELKDIFHFVTWARKPDAQESDWFLGKYVIDDRNCNVSVDEVLTGTHFRPGTKVTFVNDLFLFGSSRRYRFFELTTLPLSQVVLFRWDANRGRPICSIGIPDGYRKDFSKWFSEFKQWQDIADKCDIKLTLAGFRRSLSGDNPLIAMRMVSLYCKQVQPIELLNVIAQSRFDNETKAILMAILFSNYNQPDDEQFYDSAVNSLTEVKQGGLLIALTLAIAANDSGTYSSLMSTVKGKLDKATLALMPPVEKKANSILSAIRKRSLSIEMSAEERAKLLELLSLYPIGEI